MSASTIEDLPCPRAPYRVGCDTERPDGAIKFRSAEQEMKEETLRDRVLSGYDSLNPLKKLRARHLGKCIGRGVVRGEPPATLASALYHRQVRIPIIGALWDAVAEAGAENAAFVTLRPMGMLVEGDELQSVDLALLRRRLRNDFDRSGVTKAKGFAFVGIHAEFDANRGTSGVWDFHWHGIFVGEKIKALEALRDMRKYQAGRVHPLEQGLKELPRLQVKLGLYNLPDPLTYCLESWWVHRPTTLLPDGTRERSKRKRRLPTPYFEQWLMWMDAQRIADFVVLSGMRPGKDGFLIKP